MTPRPAKGVEAWYSSTMKRPFWKMNGSLVAESLPPGSISISARSICAPHDRKARRVMILLRTIHFALFRLLFMAFVFSRCAVRLPPFDRGCHILSRRPEFQLPSLEMLFNEVALPRFMAQSASVTLHVFHNNAVRLQNEWDPVLFNKLMEQPSAP